MTITTATCLTLAQAQTDYAHYLNDAIHLTAGPLLEPPPGSAASVIARFEIIHADAQCDVVVADACVHISTDDPDVRFVAPEPPAADNYVSYWHRESPATQGHPGWGPLPAGQKSDTNEVRMLGQTIPNQIAPESGAGYLHHLPNRPGDGWTVSVGLYHKDGASALAGMSLDVTVSARPDWTPETDIRTVQLP